MKNFLLHLFGHLWENYYELDGKIRHRFCKVCYMMEYAPDFCLDNNIKTILQYQKDFLVSNKLSEMTRQWSITK